MESLCMTVVSLMGAPAISASSFADGDYLLTPTNSCMGRLDPAKISKLDVHGKLLAGDSPSKEAFLHLAMYHERQASAAVVHLAFASCCSGVMSRRS